MNNQSDAPSEDHHGLAPEEHAALEQVGEGDPHPTTTQSSPAGSRGTEQIVDCLILMAACFATVLFSMNYVAPNRGATRSEVLKQERRQAELQKAKAEQDAYLREMANEHSGHVER